MEAHLVECPDCYEVFVETVRFLEEESSSEETEAEGARVRRGPWPGHGAWRVALPIAATVVLFLGVWILARQGWLAGFDRFPAPGELVAGLDAPELSPADVEKLVDDQGWSRYRGAGSTPDTLGLEALDEPVDPHVAFQLGALATDLELALQRPDLEKRVVVKLTGRLADLLDDEVPWSEPLAGGYRNLGRDIGADAPPAELQRTAKFLAEEVAKQVGQQPYRLGAWAEAGRLAAAAGAVEPLRRGSVWKAAKRLDRGALPAALGAAVARAVDATGPDLSAAELPEAEEAFSDLVRAGGRPWPESLPSATDPVDEGVVPDQG